MRLTLLIGLLGLSLVALHHRSDIQSVAWGLAPPGAAVGSVAPELPDTVRALDGKPVRLAQYRGRVVLLHFWTFGCANCQRMLPHHARLHRDLGARGLVVIGAHTPELPEEYDERRLAAFVRDSHIDWPVLVDSGYSLWNRYGVHAWPTAVVIDRLGVIRGTFVGDDQAGPIEAAIRKLL